MPAIIGSRVVPHTEEEKAWAIEKVNLGLYGLSAIKSNHLAEELELKFGRKISPSGLYSWLRYVKNPELKKIERQKRNNRGGSETPKNNAKFIREKETFEKSNILAYVDHNILGFENDDALKEFLMKNQVIGENIMVFKRIPIKIEYNITIGV